MNAFDRFDSNGGGPLAALTAARPRAAATAKAESAGSVSSSTSPAGSGSAADSTATITANDFLELLVAELKNQDPTANVDPNQYVNQLVEVNGLQQQIQMNQTLDGGPTLTGASSGVLQQLMQINSTLGSESAGATASSPESRTESNLARPSSGANDRAHSGRGSRPRLPAGGQNAVSNPATEAAAETVANALTANPHRAAPEGLEIPQSQMGAFAEFAARLRASQAGGVGR